MVRVEGLSIAYEAGGSRVEAVSGVGLELRRGRISAIVGPSGCGKTSIVRALAGLIAPIAGRIRISGEELSCQRLSTSVIFQDYGLLPWKTVEGNAELPLLLRGVPKAERRARALALLAELGLSGFGRYYPAQLSGGMKQRLAIARALATQPDLLLMDEPFSSLDALTREALQDSLAAIVERHGVCALIVTHSIEEAAYLAERVYVMAGQLPGGIVAALEADAAGPSDAANPDDPADAGLPAGASSAASSAPRMAGAKAGARGDYRSDPRFHALTDRVRLAMGGASAATAAPRAISPPESPVAGFKAADRSAVRGKGSLQRLGAGRIARSVPVLSKLLPGLAAVAAFMALWYAAALVLQKPFFPDPLKAFAKLAARLADGSMATHIAASARRIALAMLIVAPPSAVLGLASGRLKRLDALLAPVIYLFYPLPKIAFLPVIMLLLGLGDASKVAVIVLIVASQVLVNARDAARSVAEGYFDSAKAMGAKAMARAAHVLLPASLPALLSALRVSLGTATAVLFFAETFATDEGLGWYIMDAWARVDYPDMFAAILALSIFGLALFALIDGAEALLCRWRRVG